jgi:glutathione S-transferase
MKLYFSPGACSLSPHIVLRELGLKFDLEQVNIGVHKTKSGEDYYALNPKGYVPLLVTDSGDKLTEGPAIVQYLADQKPEAKLVSQPGTLPRYHEMEWLNFISTEIHKTFSPLFNPKTPDETKAANREKLGNRFAFVAKHLEGKSYLMGDRFTVADAYLFTVMRWAKPMGIDLATWPAVQAYFARVGERPAVKAALEFEDAAKKSAS